MKKIAIVIAVILFLLMFLTARAPAQDADARAALTQAALDYREGAHSGDAARVARAVHPEMHKVTVESIPATGKSFLRQAGASRLIQLVAADAVPLAAEKRNIEVKILDELQGRVRLWGGVGQVSASQQLVQHGAVLGVQRERLV